MYSYSQLYGRSRRGEERRKEKQEEERKEVRRRREEDEWRMGDVRSRKHRAKKGSVSRIVGEGIKRGRCAKGI